MDKSYQQIMQYIYNKHAVDKISDEDYCEIILGGSSEELDGIPVCRYQDAGFELTEPLKHLQD